MERGLRGAARSRHGGRSYAPSANSSARAIGQTGIRSGLGAMAEQGLLSAICPVRTEAEEWVPVWGDWGSDCPEHSLQLVAFLD